MFTKHFLQQKICLWQTAVVPGTMQCQVIKEVVVFVQEIKTGVRGASSCEPYYENESLYAVDADGNDWYKHWDEYPENPRWYVDFESQWTTREDGAGNSRIWTPLEAVSVYENRPKHVRVIVDIFGRPIFPKGDVGCCQDHDHFWFPGGECVGCVAAKMQIASPYEPSELIAMPRAMHSMLPRVMSRA